MTEDDFYLCLKQIAKENDLELTDKAEAIARFRARADIPLSVCPCEQGATDRGCIGPKCWDEINKFGVCLCNCFKKKV